MAGLIPIIKGRREQIERPCELLWHVGVSCSGHTRNRICNVSGEINLMDMAYLCLLDLVDHIGRH